MEAVLFLQKFLLQNYFVFLILLRTSLYLVLISSIRSIGAHSVPIEFKVQSVLVVVEWLLLVTLNLELRI